jgi:hypothetical protein
MTTQEDVACLEILYYNDEDDDEEDDEEDRYLI